MNRQWVKLCIAFAVLLLVVFPLVSMAAAITPDIVKGWFDVRWAIIMLAVGIAWKYLPFLAKFSNDLIAWVNVLSYIILKTFAPPAQAGVLDAVPDALGMLVMGAFGNAAVAHVIYEGWGRAFLTKLLKLKKPPVATVAA